MPLNFQPASIGISSPAVARASVLVIDDEREIRLMLKTLLEKEGYEVMAVESGEAALAAEEERRFDLALTDLKMPGLSGIATLQGLKRIDFDLEVLLMTGYGTMQAAVEALQYGAFGFLTKPLDFPHLRRTIDGALEKRNLLRTISLYKLSRVLLKPGRDADFNQAALDLARQMMHADVATLAQCPSGYPDFVLHSSSPEAGPPETLLREEIRRASDSRAAVRLFGEDFGPPPRAFASGLVYPLFVRDKRPGALAVFRKAGRASFTDAESRRGGVLATEIALALDNARLYGALARKVIELEKSRDQLARAEECIRAMIEVANDAIIIVNENDVIRHFNPAAEKMFGWSCQEAIGRTLAELAVPERLRDRYRMEQSARSGGDQNESLRRRLESWGLRRGGKEFPIEVSSAEIQTPEGKCLCSFIRDLSERRRAELELSRYAQAAKEREGV